MTDNVTAPVAGTKFKTKDTGANGHMPYPIWGDSAGAEVVGLQANVPAKNTALGRLRDVAGASYEKVFQLQSNIVMGSGIPAAGDHLDGLLVVPATTSPGAVTVTDGAGSAMTIFAGGASSVEDLKPFFVPIPARCTGTSWKISCGSNVSAIGVGRFT